MPNKDNNLHNKDLDNLDRLSMKDLQPLIDLINKTKIEKALKNFSNLQLKIKNERAILKQEMKDIENNYTRNDLLDLD